MDDLTEYCAPPRKKPIMAPAFIVHLYVASLPRKVYTEHNFVGADLTSNLFFFDVSQWDKLSKRLGKKFYLSIENISDKIPSEVKCF